ncbi:GNAT family N-acetyltransferase [Allomesorhizobium camelthorni]|uniref:GNAT family N-acetyltransferase n=1 Tax=Allomesorhizobium camelthorni TaxID=475069 RepID=A0A6G4W7S9_9HYPH|nr:GNAT family N-acetyltransferase [Mesorhizobium camelthorni]NGO50812.1 GNAT family N-acetyltransferase [Mesorhizobium camelthorni]
MLTTSIELVDFAPEHLEGAMLLSRQAGWPHRRDDWAMVLALSAGIVALEGDRVVGTTLVTRYGREVATINMVIVDAAMRGHGIGRRLMDCALQASEGRDCRLTATQDGLPLYEKLGFRSSGEILQHQGTLRQAAVAPADVDWATVEDIAAIAKLDQAAIGADRGALIALLSEHGRLAVLQHQGRPSGFAAVRAFGRGEVVGPVVAATADEARILISFLFAARSGAFLRLDTPYASGLAPWLAAQGLAHVGGGIAMRRDGHRPAQAAGVQTFALASQALG